MTSRADFDVPVTAHAVDLGRGPRTRHSWLRLAVTWADVEVLVNDAGAIPGVGIEEMDDDRWRGST